MVGEKCLSVTLIQKFWEERLCLNLEMLTFGIHLIKILSNRLKLFTILNLSHCLIVVNGPKTPSVKQNSQHFIYCWCNMLWQASSNTYVSMLSVRAHVCVRLCVFEACAGCRQWPLGNQGALCHASLNVWHCVSWDSAWLVYEASKNDGWVMASGGYRVCVSWVLCVCLGWG